MIEQINMNHRVCPEAPNSNSKPDFGSVSFTCLRVRQFIGDMEMLMYQQQQRVAELEDKHKQCKCKHDTQATARLVEKVAHLEEQLKSKDEQLKRKDEQLHQQAVVLDKAKPKGAAKSKKVGNGWILFMKQRSLEKDLGEKFKTLEAYLKYSKDNGPEVKKHSKRKVSLPKKGKGVGLKEFLKEMSEEYQTLDKETKTEYNDAAKMIALSEIDMGASPEIEKEIHM